MPKRNNYPKKYFTGNPLEGEPEDIYRRIQWGNEPREIIPIEAPEPLVALGEVARLELEDVVFHWDEGEAHIAVGAESNRVYIFSPDEEEIPAEGYREVGQVERTDYYSDKGGEPGYYYHEHEEPYPQCLIHSEKSVIILEPEETEDGRSYAVSDEGIIG